MIGQDDSDDDLIVLEYEQTANFNEEFWYRKSRNDSVWQKEAMPVFTKWQPTKTTIRPWGYLMHPKMAKVIPLLLDHDITVLKTAVNDSFEVEIYYATEVDNSRYFQGHYLKKFKVEKRVRTINLPAGSFFIPCGQPNSNLLCYLLEPETDDNLGTWSMFDDFVRKISQDELNRWQRMRQRSQRSSRRRTPGQEIPVYRLMKKAQIKGTVVEAFNTHERNRYVR